MKKIIDQLLSLGHNALELKLQPIHWQDKEGGKQTTFAFSNRKSSGKAIVNGKTEDAYSVSVFIPGQDQTTKAKAIVTVWCNKMEADEYQMYLEEYGALWVGILDEDNNCNIFSKDEAQKYANFEENLEHSVKASTDASQDSVNA